MKKLVNVFFMMVLFVFSFVLISCDQEDSPSKTDEESQEVETDNKTENKTEEEKTTEDEKTTEEDSEKVVNLVDKLVDGGDEVYTTTVEEEVLKIHAVKEAGKEWASLKAPIADTAGLKSLRFTINGTCKIILKIQSDAGAKEITLQLTATPTAYEWDLSPEDEQKVLAGKNFAVMMFVLPGLGKGEADVQVKSFALSSEEALFNPIQSGYTNISTDTNNYDGVSDTFDVNHFWVEKDADTYKFEDVQGGVKVTFTKKDTYNFATADIAGSYGKFPYLVFKVTGTEGQAMMMKVENGGANIRKEKSLEFNGTEQVGYLDLSEFNESQRNSFAQVMLFAAPGDAAATGNFVLHEVYYAMEAPEVKVDNSELVNEYDNRSEGFDLNKNWYNSNPGVYKVAGTQSPYKVTYNRKGSQQWSNLKTNIRGQFGNFGGVTLGMNVTEGMKFIVKVASLRADNSEEFAAEGQFVGTGKCDGFKISLAKLSVAQRDKLNTIMIFMDYENGKDAEGSYEIHWMGMEQYKYRGIGIAKYDGGQNSPDMNKFWYDGGDGVYSPVYQETKPVEVSYDKKEGQTYPSLKQGVISTKLGNFSKFVAGLEIANGKKILVKIVGQGWAVEKEYQGNGTCQEFIVDLSGKSVAERNTINEVLIFAEPGADKVNGTFKIHWAKFDGYVNQDAPLYSYDGEAQTFDINRHYKPLDAGFYVTEAIEAGLKVTYNFPDGNGWPAMISEFGGNISGMKKLNYKVTLGTATKMLVKFEGTGVNKEIVIVTSENLEGSIDLTKVDGLDLSKVSKIVIMINGGIAGHHEGNLTINKLELSK